MAAVPEDRPQPPPVTGAWRHGDAPGRRQFADIGDLKTEFGGLIPGVEVAFETWGTLSPTRDNAVLVLHALTGDSHARGVIETGHATPGWWDDLIGPGLALDTDRYFVVAPNVLGGCQGTTGPSSLAPDGKPFGSRFPYISVRDQVAAEIGLSDVLGIERWALIIGGSMGGMRAVEWAVTVPGRVSRLLLAATTAAASADQIAWCWPQTVSIRQDPGFLGGDYYGQAAGEGPHRGLGVARRIAHITYRSGAEIDLRFGREPQADEDPLGGSGRYAIESYLDHHAEKLVNRFDANSYLVLTEAMNSHDVGRGRDGVAAALGRITAATGVLAISSDRLYTVAQSAQLAALIPTSAPLVVADSPFGHDGFLLETASVAGLLARLFDDCSVSVGGA